MYRNFIAVMSITKIALISITLLLNLACMRKNSDSNESNIEKIAISKVDVDRFFNQPSVFENATNDLKEFAEKFSEAYDTEKKNQGLNLVKTMIASSEEDSEESTKNLYASIKEWLNSENFSISEQEGFILYTANPEKLCEDQDNSCIENFNKIDLTIHIYRTASTNLTLEFRVLSNRELISFHPELKPLI